ncbi:MAG: InlB B-repeat-containing protein [Clostridia bacterium]|nr:InlB B-repeat-containing protein [Clostridia bacterium]
MNKKIISIILLLIVLTASFTVFACDGAEKVKVSFVQEGYETVVVEMEKGGTLKSNEIPKPVKINKYGYEVKWDRTNFRNLTEDTVVNAVVVPKKYVVTFDPAGGKLSDIDGKRIEYLEFTFDAPYSLPVPVKENYEFKGWLIGSELFVETEIWAITDNITMTAKWEAVVD